MKKYIGILVFFGLILSLNLANLAMAKDGSDDSSESESSDSSSVSGDAKDSSGEAELEDENEAEVEDELEVGRPKPPVNNLLREQRKTFKEDAKANRDAFKETKKGERDAFKDEMKTNREALKETGKAEREALKAKFEAQRETFKTQIKTEREAFVTKLKTEKDAFLAELKTKKEAWKLVKEEKKAEFCEKAKETFSSKFSEAISKLEGFQTRVGEAVVSLKADGKDTTAAEEALKLSKTKLADAKAKLAGVKDVVPETTCADMTAEVFAQIKLQAREAKDLLKESKDSLQVSIKELKALRGLETEDESGDDNGTDATGTDDTSAPATTETTTN
ncbi:MAG: hypothetical protein KA515_00070 [Candidatus Pacebacteria bacterium]|nr:hypothetical protein [Candidatus Paceibacterota bacterium]